MKHLSEYFGEMPLEGEVETISVTELRAHVGECLDMVHMGKTLRIARKGKMIALLVHPSKAAIEQEED